MKRLTKVVLVVLLVGAIVAPAAIAAGQSAESDAGDEYTIDELRQDGKHYSVPSARIVSSEQRVYWLEHRPVNQPWADVTPTQNGPKFDQETLKTNTLYLRTIRAQESTEQVNVTLVYWNQETREVTNGNTTTTEQYAANVSVVEKSVTLGPGWSVGEISLPRHEETTRVTMFLNDHSEDARWTFKHRSVATSQPIDVSTWSEFIMLAAGFVIVPALGFGAYGGRKVKKWIDKVGEPPGHGFGYYLGVTTVLTGLIVFGAYYNAAEVIVAIPVILGLYVGVVYVGYMLATHEGKAEHKLFWQPHIESVESFTSTKIPSIGAGNEGQEFDFSQDMPFGKMKTFKVLDEGQNGMSIVRPGWYAFLARLKGGRAKIQNANELKTRFSLWESAWSECFIIDPDADKLIDYEPPGLTFKKPEIKDKTDLVWPGVLLGGGSLIAWQATQVYGPVAWTILLIALPLLTWKFAVTGTESHVRIEPAPAAMRPVLASMLAIHVGYDDASTLEEAEEFAWRALAGREQEELSWERNRDSTFIDETFSGRRKGKKSTSSESDGDGDSASDGAGEGSTSSEVNADD